MARIGVDADGTAYNLIEPWLGLWEMESGRRHSPEDVVHYNPHRILGADGGEMTPEETERFYGLLESEGLFLNLRPFDGALEGIKELHDDGHEVHIVSAPAGPVSAYEKLRAFKRDFPWMNRKHVNLVHRKHLLDLDILIDDAPENAEAMRRARPSTLVVGLEMPWNRAHRELWHLLAKDWRQILDFIKAHQEALRAPARRGRVAA